MISNIKCFCRPKSIFRHYCIQNVEEGIQIRVYKISKGSVARCSQLLSLKAKKISRSISGNARKIDARLK